MVKGLPSTTKGSRDRAVIMLGFFGAFRRSELVSLDLADLEFGDQGITITLRRSKTDQTGEGRLVAIPWGLDPETCPVGCLEHWIELAGVKSGPIFRQVTKGGGVSADRLSDRGVARIVKSAAERAGLDPAEFAGHSLRSGFATSAAMSGANDRAIMNQTGHKSRAMVDRYVQRVTVWQENAAGLVRV